MTKSSRINDERDALMVALRNAADTRYAGVSDAVSLYLVQETAKDIVSQLVIELHQLGYRIEPREEVAS